MCCYLHEISIYFGIVMIDFTYMWTNEPVWDCAWKLLCGTSSGLSGIALRVLEHQFDVRRKVILLLSKLKANSIYSLSWI